MRIFEHSISVALACAVIITSSQLGYASEKPCPSADDVAYSTQVGETWAALGGRAYCLDGPHARSRAALALYEYNRGRVGRNVDLLGDGITVCIPKYLHGPFFDAERCRSAPVSADATTEPAPSAAPPAAAICGNGQREGEEVCDNNDLGGATCGTFSLPAGILACRADCHGIDASGCVQKPKPEPPPVEQPASPPKRPDEPSKSTRLSLSGEFAAGAIFPMSERQRAGFYGAMGLVRPGARMGVGPIEAAVHGLIGGGRGTTTFNDIESELGTFVIGGGIQAGVPIALGSFRFTPGAELMRVWMRRTIDMPPAYRPKHTEDAGGMTLLGVFLRSEYRFRQVPRLAACIEIAVDLVPRQVADFARSDNFQMKTLAGVTYAAF